MARWLRPNALALRLAGCMLCVTLATSLAGAMAEGNLIWVANGVLLAYLLLVPRPLWPAYLCAGLLGHAVGALLIHTAWQVNLLDTPLDVLEASLGALFLRRRSAQLPRFTQGRYLLRFLGCAVLAAPLITGLVHGLVAALWLHAPFALTLLQWIATDSLGACLVTPACVAIFRTRTLRSLCTGWHWAYLVPVAGVTVAIFSQAKVPLPFVLYPFLVLILLRLGLGWAATATLFVAAAGGWFTVHGVGPFASSQSLSRLEPAVILQLFLATAMFMLYSVSAVIENLRRAEHRLQEIASLHKLVTENSRDIILLADFDGVPRFISPAVEAITGYKPSETRRRGFADVIHAEDLPRMRTLIRNLQEGAESENIEYRVRRRDGEFIWVEGSLRILRDARTGIRTGILQIVRDISERKLAEKQLAEAYRAVEAMAITDALTGLANRRGFDQCLTTEWRRGMRERTPLSVVLIDADLFKAYNDTYGHLRGDSCLKQIAEAIQDVVSRPGDLVARFGGEEFAVVLPNTPAPGAFQLAQDICAVMRGRQLPHPASPIGVVTISAGSATLLPQPGQHAMTLIDCADQALYQAKRTGRNRACAYRADPNTDIAEIAGKKSHALAAKSA